MVEYKIWLQGSDGKSYVIPYSTLWDILKEQMSYDEKFGWNDVTRNLREDVNQIQDTLLREVLIPKAKTAIIEFLKENPNVPTRNFYDKAWSLWRRSNAWYYAKQELEAEGVIVSESHGRGQNRTWKLAKS